MNPGGTPSSFGDGLPDLRKGLVCRNCLHATATHFIDAAARFAHPELADKAIFGRIKTLDESICEQGAGLAWQGQGFFGDLFDGHVHGVSSGNGAYCSPAMTSKPRAESRRPSRPAVSHRGAWRRAENAREGRRAIAQRRRKKWRSRGTG